MVAVDRDLSGAIDAGEWLVRRYAHALIFNLDGDPLSQNAGKGALEEVRDRQIPHLEARKMLGRLVEGGGEQVRVRLLVH